MRLNARQLDKLSDISSDVGLVALASVALPALFEKFNILVILIGSSLTIMFWAISLWLRR